jgi:hypothetical protein
MSSSTPGSSPSPAPPRPGDREPPDLTAAQGAAAARLAYAIEQPGSLSLLLGPEGVGKTTVLAHVAVATAPALAPLPVHSFADLRDGAASVSPAFPAPDGPAVGRDAVPDVLLVDDAHRAAAGELADAVAAWRRRRPGAAIVLAGTGRLVSLVVRDDRLERALRLRAVLPAFTLPETRGLLAAWLPGLRDTPNRTAAIRTIHEIAGGMPAGVLRLAEMAALLLASDPHRDLTADDVEAVHRRICATVA